MSSTTTAAVLAALAMAKVLSSGRLQLIQRALTFILFSPYAALCVAAAALLLSFCVPSVQSESHGANT